MELFSSVIHQTPVLHSQEETKAQWCVFELDRPGLDF